MTHPQLTELAQQPENAQPGCCGVSFLPYLVGERTPNWPQATGALLGLTPGMFYCLSKQSFGPAWSRKGIVHQHRLGPWPRGLPPCAGKLRESHAAL